MTWVEFTITNDGVADYYPPQPIRCGLMVDMVRKAARGASPSSLVVKQVRPPLHF